MTPVPSSTLSGATMLTQLGRSDYATANWTLVVAAGDRESAESREAVASLCGIYWYPVYALIRKRGHAADEAQDLLQEFLNAFIARRYFAGADVKTSDFRTYLMNCVESFLDGAKGRVAASPLPFETATAESLYAKEPVKEETPERIYNRRWARALLDRVYNRLRDEFVRHGRLDHFHHLKGYLAGNGDAPYGELSAKLGLTEGALKIGIHRLRKRYRDLLREEAAATVTNPESVDAELRFLMMALSGK